MWRRLVTVVSVCLLAGVLAPVAAPLVSAIEASPANIFHGVTPARLLETRSGADKLTVDGTFQGEGVLGPNGYLDLVVAGRVGSGVPGNAGAVALNVTAINPSANSFITIYPAGETQPNASNLNLAAGRTLPNMVIVPVGELQSVTVFNSAGSTHMAVDVLGWFPDATTAFGAVSPARLLETRVGADKVTVDHLYEGDGPVGPNSTTDLEITTRGNVPADAGAVALNVTAIGPSATSYLTIWPKGVSRPNASNLNLAAGRTVPNMVIVPIGDDGSISIYNAAGTTHLAVDVLGWFPSATTAFSGLNPARLLETRTGADKLTVDHLFEGDGAQGPNTTLDLDIAGRGFVPADAAAVALNVTAISPTANSFITIYPRGQTRPNASNLNLAAGRTLPNMVIVPLGAGGAISIYNSAGTTHLAVDVLGWFPTAATTTRVSVANVVGEANGAGGFTPEITADGTSIMYQSSASNLVSGDTNGAGDVYVRDLTTGTNELASRASGAAGALGDNNAFAADITDDARFVVFYGMSSQYVAGDTNATWDTFVRDRDTDTTTRISVANNGAEGNDQSYFGSISNDGRYVVFESKATNLVVGDTNGAADIFLRDLTGGTTTLISRASGGVTESDGISSQPQISSDGAFIVYQSNATNLVVGDTNAAQDIFLYEVATQTTTRISVTSAEAQASGISELPRISADGTFISFISYATDIVPGKTTTKGDIIVRDTAAGTTTRVSVSSAGIEADDGSYYHDITDDGNTIVFESYATNLTSPATGGNSDVFVHDMDTGDTTQVNVATNGTPSGAFSYHPRVSADGLRIVYASDADTLVIGDTNLVRDIFLYDRS